MGWSGRFTGLILLLVLCLSWGLAFVAIKMSLIYLSPVSLTFLRFSVASILFALYLLYRGAPIPLRLVPRVALLGFTGFTVYHLSLNLGETGTAAGIAGLVVASSPVFITLLSRAVLGEKLTILKVVGTASGLLGLAVMITPSLQASGNPIRVLAILPAPITSALYTVLGKLYLKEGEPAVLTGYAQLFGLLLLTPIASKSVILEAASLPLTGWIPILFLGICSTTLGYTIWFKLLKMGEASMVGNYIYLTTLVAILGGRIILNEPFTLNLAAGGILVVSGVYLTHRGSTGQNPQ
ncbi:MAG: DMT family transporter [Candidatus Bathyarchaeia archaeon]